MAERRCEGCRFFYDLPDNEYGLCRRNPPVGESDLPATGPNDWCGEWRDKDITPEQEERQELVRRFAVAIATQDHCRSNKLHWEMAAGMADAEPPANP